MRKRMNSWVDAVNYEINHFIEVDNPGKKFDFEETITLDVRKPVKSYIAHGKNLVLRNVKLLDGKSDFKIDNIKYDKKKDVIKFVFPSVVKKGLVKLRFSGKGNYGDVTGLYLSKYKFKSKDKFIATTQFEPAYARNAFVCEDEPNAKATFDISITLDKKLMAVSNMPEKKTVLLGNKKKVIFHRTPKMSTYLAYIGAGNFETKETKAGKTKLRVVTLPGRVKDAVYGLNATKKLLLQKEKFYGIRFPLPKLDMIAIPDYAAAAMENWGAITFREDVLINNLKTAPSSLKIRTVATISHELEHMWFGNLVTMEWWEDLWLNESFAEVRAYNGVAETHPELDPWADFLSSRVNSAYILDGLTNSHPIHVNVNFPDEANSIFDAISYSKGGMVLRMVEHLLGTKTYQKGLRYYLKKHSYSNAQASDLWSALGKVSGKPVGKIVDSWINKKGFPVLDVSIEGKKLLVSQRRFRYLGSDRNVLWKIPLSILTNDGKINGVILDDRNKIINLKSNFIKINSGEFGFYRVKYSKELLNNLMKFILKKKISNIDRWGVHNDLFALCLACEISLKDYLDFVVNSYKNEDDYMVLSDVISSLQKIRIITEGEKGSNELHVKINDFFLVLFRRFGWKKKRGEKEIKSSIRASLINCLGKLDDIEVLKKAKELGEREIKKPGSIDPDLRSVFYKLMAWQGDERTFEKLIKTRKEALDQSKRNNMMEALEILGAVGNFKDKNILKKAMDYGLSKEVKSSDLIYLISNLLANPFAKDLVWPWMKKNWKVIRAYYEELTNHFSKILHGMSVISNVKFAKEVEIFIKKNPVYSSERSVKQMIELTKINERFLKKNKFIS